MSGLHPRSRVAVFLSLCVVFGAWLYLIIAAWICSHPVVRLPSRNRESFARVAILMDGSLPVRAERFASIKKIIQKKVIPSLGTNDVARCYDVRPAFSIEQNTVFGLREGQPPTPKIHSAKILKILRQGWVSEETYNLVRALSPDWQSLEEVRKAWTKRVAVRGQPEELGSDLCGALGHIGPWLSLGDRATQRWLLVLSDLRNEAVGQPCRAEEFLPEARIVLLYPLDSEGPRWEEVEGFSQRFFGERSIDRIPFSALTEGPLLPPNPTAGLEAYQVPTMWECVRPRLGSVLVASGMLVAATWLVAVWVGRRREQPIPRRSSTQGPETSGA